MSHLSGDNPRIDHLSPDLWWVIGLSLDCQSLGRYGLISKEWYSFFYQTDRLTDILRYQLERVTRFELASFSRAQLIYLSQVKDQNNRLSAGINHSLAINGAEEVFSWGNNKFGQLGLRNRESQLRPVKISSQKTQAVAAGKSHSLILASGKVYYFGCGNYSLATQRLGEEDRPTLFGLNEVKITAISTGDYHSLLLDAQGQVWGFGCNKLGQVGVGSSSDQLSHPTRIDLSHPALAIAAGSFHSLVLLLPIASSSSQVLSFGDNDCGQLGLGDTQRRYLPKSIPNLPGTIVSLSAGKEHSLFLTSQGQVYHCGYNWDETSESEGCQYLTILTLVSSPYGTGGDKAVLYSSSLTKPIIALSAGGYHSLFLDLEGQVFKMGIQDHEDPYSIKVIKTLQRLQIPGQVTAISAGSSHSLLGTFSGQLFSLGRNEEGQLGLGNYQDRYIPSLLHFKDDQLPKGPTSIG
jgi:alpha-tubulin suppressor-like RCC1 family protein